MNKAMLKLRQRRGELLMRISVQRDEMAEIGGRMKAPMALADQILAAARFLRSQPVLAFSLVAILAVKRRGVAGMLKVVWRLWRGYRYFTNLSVKYLSRL